MVYLATEAILEMLPGGPHLGFLFADGTPTGKTQLFLAGSAIALTQIITSPACYLVAAVLYLDLRVRREGLDIEWAERLSRPATGVSSVEEESSQGESVEINVMPNDESDAPRFPFEGRSP
jgi:hypothetical protein